MSVDRQSELLRKMRRSLISLRIQTPQPITQRLPSTWYAAALLTWVVLAAAISTRAALIYRTQLHTLSARVVYVQHQNDQRRDARKAALVAYETRPRRVVEQQLPTAPVVATSVVSPKPVLLQSTKEKVRSPVKSTRSTTSRISVSSSRAPATRPRFVEDAFHRLQRGRDDVALAWLLGEVTRFKDEPAWERFQYVQADQQNKERYYQLGVLFGALAESGRALHWLTLAAASTTNPRYTRAFAIAADKVGNRQQAIAAYRRYLSSPVARDAAEILGRVATLESR